MQKFAAFQRHQTLLWVLLSAALIIFCKSWETGLGISSTTFGAMAKNILVDHDWMHIKLAPGIFDPFVDHPPLVIWMDAIVFKIFGVSAQTVRLVASLFGISVFASLFLTVQARQSELAATFACLALMLVNVYINFNSSGWLDLPMVGLTWLGMATLTSAKNTAAKSASNPSYYKIALGACFLGCAVLAKGASALAVIPIMLWLLITVRNWKSRLLASLMFLLPIVVFTAAYYQSQGFIFWERYFFREAVVQNHIEHETAADFFWYVKALVKYGHVLIILGLLGCRRLFKSGQVDLAILILAELLIHIVAYTLSARHFPQYTVPVFPWLALGSGIALEDIFRKARAPMLAKGMAITAMAVFVVLDMLPVRVHAGSENPLRAMTSSVNLLGDNKTVYFYGQTEDQSPWEAMSSYIVWFWDRKPVMVSVDELFDRLSNQDPRALGIMKADDFASFGQARLSHYEKVKICFENDDVILFTNRNLCTEAVLRQRPRENHRQVFAR